MLGGMYAASACAEVLRYIEELEEEGISLAQILELVKIRLREIRKSGEDGWY
jgi:hypothetical protein